MEAERDTNGRFVAGNKASRNGGRPKKAREERYQEILTTSITFVDFQAIIHKLRDKAKRGDIAAAKLLLEYLVGKPPQQHEHTGKVRLSFCEVD